MRKVVKDFDKKPLSLTKQETLDHLKIIIESKDAKKINSDFTLMLDAVQKPIQSNRQLAQVTPKYEVKQKQFSEEEKGFWLKFGIDEQTLKRFNVSSLDQFSTTSKIGNPYTTKSSSDKFIS